MTQFVERMIETTQHICARLRPAILDDLGLEAALEWQVDQFAQRGKQQYNLELDIRGLKPDNERDTAVFRIVQEALTNVARHAQATAVTLRATMKSDALVLEIEDDGIGISEAMMTSSRSLGLIGMRERAEAIGAVLNFTRTHERGTTVALNVPLDEPARRTS